MRRLTGKEEVIYLKPKASTEILEGTPLQIGTNGLVEKAGASTTVETFKGILVGNSSADSDGARPVDVIANSSDMFKISIGAGTFTQNKVGKTYDFDANGELNLSAEGLILELVGTDGTDAIVRKN